AFDLELEQSLQRDTPPFRDGYQTATYFAIQFLLHDTNFDESHYEVRKMREERRSWSEPLVFEIGRTRALTLGRERELSRGDCRIWDFNCIEVHPRSSPAIPALPTGLRGTTGLIAALTVMFIGVLVIQNGTPARRNLAMRSRMLRQMAVVLALAVLTYGLVLS